MKKLSDILANTGAEIVSGAPGRPIGSISFDSRVIGANCLFVAVKGTQTDGHRYIDAAIGKGAVALLAEELPAQLQAEVAYVRSENSARALGWIASNFYGNPSKNLRLVGVTGTNGKTTIATLLHQLFGSLGYESGLLSTIRNKIGLKEIGSTHTTPDAIQLNELMAKMVESGCTYCFMEVSSHAVDQFRTEGLEFAGGIFTNITHDHLDYHKTFDAYLRAKKSFFDRLPAGAFALTNADDRNGLVMTQNTSASISTYGLRKSSDFKVKLLESSLDGLELVFGNNPVWCGLVGEFNAYNLAAIYGAASLLGIPGEELFPAMSALTPVEGRFDYVKSGSGITAIVDYAHTPDALKNVLGTIARLRSGNETVITVMGAGGDRDPAKRPAMGSISAEMSNKLIITSDNPRSEKPEDIIEAIYAGINPARRSGVLKIENRREAIKTACMLANPGDIILVAGKGHEKYQEIKGIKHPFDDKALLAELLATTKQ